MEILQIILESVYSLLAQLVIVWPVAALVVGAYLTLGPSGKYKKLGGVSFMAASAFALIFVIIYAAGQAYSIKAMPYQQAGVGIYYIILVLWIAYTVRGIRRNSK